MFMLIAGSVSTYLMLKARRAPIFMSTAIVPTTSAIVTMLLVVSTTGVLLKMGARLAFDIKYVLTLPAISMNF